MWQDKFGSNDAWPGPRLNLTITLAPSQGCMAPSIEARTALARFGVPFWKVPVNLSAYPGFS